MPPPGQHARKKARELRWLLVKNNTLLITGFGLACLMPFAVVTTLAFIAGDQSVLWFIAGALLTCGMWFVWDFIDRESGARSWAAGAGGEGLTAAALRKTRTLHVVHGLQFGFDIDHVVIGPGGVAAIETKWSPRNLDVLRQPRERRLADDLQETTRRANKIRSFLQGSARLRDVDVKPVLILWGAGVMDIPEGRTVIDGVELLIGRQAKEWRDLFLAEHHLDEWSQRACLEALAIREQEQSGI